MLHNWRIRGYTETATLGSGFKFFWKFRGKLGRAPGWFVSLLGTPPAPQQKVFVVLYLVTLLSNNKIHDALSVEARSSEVSSATHAIQLYECIIQGKKSPRTEKSKTRNKTNLTKQTNKKTLHSAVYIFKWGIRHTSSIDCAGKLWSGNETTLEC